MRRVLTGIAVIAAAAVHAEPPAAVRVGDHPGFGRVVFDLPDASPFQLAQHGNRILLTFSGSPSVGMPESVPRNVLSVVSGSASATLTIVPGARIRSAQMGNRVVIDILDPAPRLRAVAPNVPAVAPAPASSVTPAPIPAPVPAPVPEPPQPPIPAARPEPVVAEPAGGASQTLEPPTPPPSVVAGPLLVPAAPTIGVAAFRRGDLGMVVFDDRVTVDASQFEGRPGFAGAALRENGRGAVLTVPLAPDQTLEVTRSSDGWLVAPGSAKSPVAEPVPVADGIGFRFDQPGRVLAIRDPLTGQSLLVGTSRLAAEKGRSVATGRAAPGYVLLPTWLGLALEPSADRVDLRASLSGFTLVTPDADSPAKTATALRESQFGLPMAAAPILLQQLHAQIAGAAGSAARGRGPERVAAARTMLALGLAAEAQALLTLAAEDDPAIASDPKVNALAGMAAVLAGRPAEAGGLDAPEVGSSPEIELWRALRDVGQGKPAELASYMELLPAYPSAIRLHLLPLVAEAAVQSGRKPALDADTAALPQLAFARALQSEREGQTEQALAAYDALERGRDAKLSVRAATAAAELRLAKAQINPAAAADILERQAMRWRGDGREIETRLRAAELRTQAGQWRPALEWLRETEQFFPKAKQDVAPRKASVFKALASARKDDIAPLEMVTLAGDFADCIPDGPDGDAVAGLLADKLAALDLPSRAIPVLQKLMQGSASSRAKAEFALRLGQLYLDAGEPAKAEAVVSALDSSELGPDRAEAGQILAAKARAAGGDAAGALGMLVRMSSLAAQELRASLAAKAGDWRTSLEALSEIAAKSIPSEGELNEKQQDLVVRQAIAAVQAGDSAMLKRLEVLAPRITSPRSEKFKLLTASAVQNPDDLPRAARELAMARSFSDRTDRSQAR